MNRGICGSAVIVSIFVTPGCADAIHVYKEKKAKDAKQAGVPFYIKVERHRQKTIYERYWYDVALSVSRIKVVRVKQELKTLEKKNTYRRRVAMNENNESLLDRLRGAISHKSPSYQEVMEAFDALINLSQSALAKPTINDVQLTENTVEAVAVVDYDTTYYLNGPLPWFGTGTVLSELNADGTLSKASATSDTKLAELIPSVLPIKESFSAEEKVDELTTSEQMPPIVLTPEAAADFRKVVDDTIHFEFTIEESGYRYIFRQTTEGAAAPPTPILFALDTGNFVREPINAATARNDDKDNRVDFSGTVKLPKQ
jgi:hypothetical protein